MFLNFGEVMEYVERFILDVFYGKGYCLIYDVIVELFED